MDFLIVSVGRDYSNLGYALEQCLRKVGVDALALATRRTVTVKPACAKIVNVDEMRNYAKEAKIIIFLHSVYTDLDIKKNQKILVWHTGTRFRQHSKDINKIFNPIVTASLCGRDVFGLGAKNEKNILATVDTDMLKPNYKRANENKIIIAHYPTGNKGIDVIKKCIEEVNKSSFKDKFIFKYSKKIVNSKAHMERVSKCDIYIEDIKEKQGDQLLSVYGISAIEAAALGKIVITRFLFLEEYEKKYGKCGLQIANTPNELTQQIKRIISLSDDDLLKLKIQSREWAVRYHSYKAVGESMLKLLHEIGCPL